MLETFLGWKLFFLSWRLAQNWVPMYGGSGHSPRTPHNLVGPQSRRVLNLSNTPSPHRGAGGLKTPCGEWPPPPDHGELDPSSRGLIWAAAVSAFFRKKQIHVFSETTIIPRIRCSKTCKNSTSYSPFLFPGQYLVFRYGGKTSWISGLRKSKNSTT